MACQRPAKEHVEAVHRYLAKEFPGYVQRSWWEEDTTSQIFEIENGVVLRRLVIDGGVFWDCPDCTVALSFSDLTDYMRAIRTHTRCFYLLWQDGMLLIRSTAL